MDTGKFEPIVEHSIAVENFLKIAKSANNKQ